MKIVNSIFFLSLVNLRFLSLAACISPKTSCDSNNSNCDCCEPGYYLNNPVCEPCVTHCSACTSFLTCTRCYPSYYLNQNGFMPDCQSCAGPCLTCNSFPACQSCLDVNAIFDGTTCSCNSGYYMDSSYHCQPCTLPCAACQTNANHCLTCIDTHQSVDSSFACVCNAGWISNGNYCDQCTSPCLTCSLSTTLCDSCSDVNHILTSSNQCLCKETYYSDTISTCSPCILPCQNCDANGCLTCIADNQTIDTNNLCVCIEGTYLNSNNIDCLNCQPSCSKCLSATQCTECKDGYYLDGISCIKCDILCETCLQQDECITCFIGYYLDQMNQCIVCQPTCLQCIGTNNCLQCNEGYYLTNYQCEKCSDNCNMCLDQYDNCTVCNSNYLLLNGQCICQSGNYEINNQCIPCLYPCIKCLNSDVCNQCDILPNLYLNEQNQCTCLEGYYLLQGICLQCDPTCQTCQQNQHNCSSCNVELNRILQTGKCICKAHYFENNEKYCQSCDSEEGKLLESCKYSNCSDQIWTYGEQCDDGNNVIRDGCSNCVVDQNYYCINVLMQPSICIQCSQNCGKCGLNNLNIADCLHCLPGYFLFQSSCQQCSNECLECSENAHNCTSCRFYQDKQQKCQLCESQQGYFSDFKTNTCFSICGDSILASDEECDDGNQLSSDGCNRICKLEIGFECNDSICKMSEYPTPTIMAFGDCSIFQPIRYFQLKYDTPLNISNSFNISNFVELYITTSQTNRAIDYHFQITQYVDSNQNKSINLSAIIKINLNKFSKNEQLMIKFLNQQQIVSIEGYPQQLQNIFTPISEYNHIDDQTKKQVQMLTSTNYYILIALGAMAGGALLFGGIGIFYNLFDILQTLSYLQYVNIQFPYNLQVFFNFFKFAQLSFISTYLNLQDLFDNHFSYQLQKPTPLKISDDGYDSLFILNVASLIIVWVSVIGIFLLATISLKILRRIKFSYQPDKIEKEKIFLQIKIFLLTVKLYFQEICHKITQEFFYSGLLRTFLSTAQEFSFVLMLQIYCLEQNSSYQLVRFSSYFSLLSLLLYSTLVYVVVTLVNIKKYELRRASYLMKYGSILEGINSGLFSQYINALLLIKKIAFMTILIFFYESPLYQIINLTLLMICSSMIIFDLKAFSDENEFYKQLTCEVSTLPMKKKSLFSLAFLAGTRTITVGAKLDYRKNSS